MNTKKIFFSTVLFLVMLCSNAQAQNFFTTSKAAYISNISTGGYTTDTLFTLSAKYEFASVQAFGYSGQYCEVRLYSGSTTYGTFRVYSGQIINIPNPPNLVSVIPDMDIDLGTLTEIVNEVGDTIPPFVYCIAFTK